METTFLGRKIIVKNREKKRDMIVKKDALLLKVYKKIKTMIKI